MSRSAPDDCCKALTAEERASVRRTDAEALTSIEGDVLAQIAGAAQAMEVPIILRSVNPDALPILKKRNAVGKNMAVHGKSSEEPILAGYIPERSSISKAGRRDNPVDIDKANRENSHSLHTSEEMIENYRRLKANAREGRTESHELDATLAELQRKAVVSAGLLTTTGEQIYIFENTRSIAKKDVSNKTIFAIKRGDDFYPIDKNHHIVGRAIDIGSEYKPVAVKIFCKPSFNRDGSIARVLPITADIDVLAYGSRMSDLSHDTYDRRDVEDMIGQGPDVLKAVVRDVIAPTIGRDLISHGPEQYNLDYVQPLEAPWISVESDGRVSIVRSESELLALFNIHKPLDRIIGAGHIKQTSMEPNPHWGWELDKRTKAFRINPDLKRLFKDVDHAVKHLSNSRKEEDHELMRLLQATKLQIGMAYLNPAATVERRELLRSNLEERISKLSIELPSDRHKDDSETPTILSGAKFSDLSAGEQSKIYAERSRTSSVFPPPPTPSISVRVVPNPSMRAKVAAKMDEFRPHPARADYRTTSTAYGVHIAAPTSSGRAASSSSVVTRPGVSSVSATPAHTSSRAGPAVRVDETVSMLGKALAAHTPDGAASKYYERRMAAAQNKLRNQSSTL